MSVESDEASASEHEHPAEPQSCPTPTAHKRLAEADRWWRGCRDAYDDPPGFRANLNACLQALRNVTFALQKEKRSIPDFDTWYPQQQELMRADPIMKWLINSRNQVVKSGDLELLSTATMRAILQYQDIASAVTESLPDSTTTRVKTLPLYARPSDYHTFLAGVPSAILAQSSIFIERRWVDKALPDRELLDALAHCYGSLSGLLDRAHAQAGVPSHAPLSQETGRALKGQLAHKGRPPYMITTLEMRTTHYRFGGNELVRSDVHTLNLPKTMSARAMRRYNVSRLQQEMGTAKETVFDYMTPLMTQARHVLQKDKNHVFIAFLFKGTMIYAIQGATFHDRATKHAYVRELANQIAANGVDGIITLGELWYTDIALDDEGSVIAPQERPDKREALEVYAETKDGGHRSSLTFFHRRFSRIVFDDEHAQEEEAVKNNFMHPIRQVWASMSSREDTQDKNQ
jgi:hypothetical protein